MWLLKLTTVLVLIKTISTTKNEYLALEEIHDELARIQKRANEYRLESDVHSDRSSPIQVHDWITNRNTKFMDLQGAYENLDLSEGFPGQTELLDLYDEEMESGYTDDIGENVLEGFNELEELRKKLVALDGDEITKKVQALEKRRDAINAIEDVILIHLKRSLDILGHCRRTILYIDEFTSSFPKIEKLSDGERRDCFEYIKHLKLGLQNFALIIPSLRDYLKESGFLDAEGVFDPFKEVKEVTNNVISKMDSFKKWEELSGKVVEEINRLKTLKPIVPNVNKVFEDVKKDFEHFKDYEISEKVYKRYQDIQSLKPLLQKIRSLTSFMNKLEQRVKKMMEASKSTKEHFEKLEIHDDLSTGMFEGLQKCLKMFDSSKEISRKELDRIDEPLELIRRGNDVLNEHFNLVNGEIFKENERELKKYNDPKDLDDMIYEPLKNLRERFQQLSEKVRHQDQLIQEGLLAVKDNVERLNLDEMKTFAEKSTDQLNNVKEVLVCYGDLNVESSNIETLLDSMKDKWNFNPMDLERTVEVLEIFKDAYKRVKEVWDWKRDGYDPNDNTPNNRFVLSEEDVKKITVVLDGFESIRNVEKRWDSLKDLDIQNEHWNNLNESVSSFLEHVSKLDSKMSLIDFFALEPFQLNGYKDNIKNQVKKFIDEEYEGSRKSGILNLLEEIEQVIEKYPTVDMIKNMEEAVKEMKNWEKKKNSGKEEENQTFIDCSMNPCDVIPKLPPVGPDAPVKNAEL